MKANDVPSQERSWHPTLDMTKLLLNKYQNKCHVSREEETSKTMEKLFNWNAPLIKQVTDQQQPIYDAF